MQAKEALGRVVQDREVLGAQVLAPAQPVLGPGPAVVVEGLGQELAPTHVEHEGHARLGQPGPDRLEVDVGRREGARRVRGHPQGGHAGVERGLERVDGPFGAVEGQVADGLETVVGRAERRHGPVERLGPAVEDVEVLAEGEMPGGERREDELGRDPEGVEHPGAHVAVEGTRGHPALGTLQDLGADVGLALGRPQVGQARHQLGRPAARSPQAEGGQALAHRGVGEARPATPASPSGGCRRRRSCCVMVPPGGVASAL